MRYYSEKSTAERLVQAEEAIVIGQNNPELSEVFAGQGYSETEFNKGAQLVASVREADTLQREQLGNQIVATATANKAYRLLRRSFDADRKVVRIVLEEQPEYVEVLRLSERTSRRREDFILQARHFYEKVMEHAEVMTLLANRYNITPEVLVARRQEISDLEEALIEQQYLIGLTREVIRQRQEAVASLDVWMRRFIAVARIAFKNDVSQLQKLGIVVKVKSS